MKTVNALKIAAKRNTGTKIINTIDSNMPQTSILILPLSHMLT